MNGVYTSYRFDNTEFYKRYWGFDVKLTLLSKFPNLDEDLLRQIAQTVLITAEEYIKDHKEESYDDGWNDEKRENKQKLENLEKEISQLEKENRELKYQYEKLQKHHR